MSAQMELMAPCHFGLEAVLKREIQDLGYEISCVEDGRVTFYGDAEAIAVSNMFLRSAERILCAAADQHRRADPGGLFPDHGNHREKSGRYFKGEGMR